MDRNIKIVTLGCAKNEVDSEEIAGVLRQAGHNVDASAEPDITVINTCGFLESAKQESIKAIREAVAHKGAGKVVVAGCLAQRLGAELERLAPGADSYVGVGQMGRFGDIVQSTLGGTQPLIDVKPPHHIWADVAGRAKSGSPWTAYLKVSEGCDHKCTFCTIPSFRGAHQSKTVERVVEEAEHLAAEGCKEINLVAQDVTQYGYDLYKKFTLPLLLKALNGIDGISWIRLLYFYPNRLTDEVIESMASLPKVLPYIDVPLQHVDPEILRSMKRPWDGERYLRLFEKLRAAMPEAAIRTTFIVGFPGETESHFSALLDFVREAKLERVGAFMYSREPGTPAAELPGQVPARVKQDRYARLMRLQSIVAAEASARFVGKRLDVLVEQEDGLRSIGRSYRDAPEIDGHVEVDGPLSPGQIVEVNVTAADVHDLKATFVG